jgi:hypothetical protein
MQMKMKLKTTGEGRKLPGAGKHGCGRQRWWKVAVTASVFSFLPSYLLCFSSQPPLASVFSVVFSFSPLSLWGRQRRSGGALWRWRGSAVAAVVVLLLWYFFFFLCDFLFFPASLMASLSLFFFWWLKVVAMGRNSNGGVTAPWLWRPVLLFSFFFTVLQQGEEDSSRR